MILYGAGGHAKVVISSLVANHITISGIVDDNPDKKEMLGFPIFNQYDPYFFPDEQIIITIGNNHLRRLVSKQIMHDFGTVIYRQTIIDPGVNIEMGTVILHGAIIQAGTSVGRHVIINTAVSIDHDCVISDFVHVAPGCVLTGNVHIGENTLVGAGSIITPNINIGKNCQIAAGSVVTKDIPDHAIVRGNPARIVKYIV